MSKLQLIKNKNIESIYPLSHLQHGMLFHTLHEPESGVYIEQFCLTLSGNLDIKLLQQACTQVVKRHPVLRTLVVWEKQEKPLQVVCKQVDLPWQIYDWRSLSAKTQKEHLEEFLHADRLQGFVFDQAPLMRFTLIQVADDIYEFIWSFHHLLIDGWSLPILCKEVFAFYHALIKGEYLYLNTPRAYRNYINWLQQQDLKAAKAFWQQQLQGFTSPTRLLLNRGEVQDSPQLKTYHQHQCCLSATITAALQSQAQQYHLTVSTFIQAAWAILLSRYTDESEILFGATVSGRPPTLSGVESMVGLFINTLPVRVKVPTATPLWQWLRELQTQQVERSQYSWFPLVEIQTISDIPSELPLFESIVVFENYPQNPSLSNPGTSIQITKRRVIEQTNYPLTIIAVTGQELSLRILYDGSRFDEETITRMMGHLVTLLEGMVANIEQTVPEIPMLTAAEQQQILAWNDTQTDYPQKCIAQLFAEQVERTPDAVAVSFQSQQLTYQELNCQANQLAHHLQNLGVKPEVRVGICIERSLAMVVGILAILKAGGAYIPLDPRSPQERLSYMLSDAQASILLTNSSISLSQLLLTVVYLDKSEIFCHHSQENPVSEVTPDNLAYVMYTSGSTGKPKGVAMNQHSLVNLLHWQIQQSAVNFAKTLQFASISFDVSFQEIFSTLCSGGTLVLITAEIQKDGFALLQLIDQEKIERLFLPFVALQQLAHAAAITQIYPPSLRQIITAGEALQITPDLVKFFEQLPGCRLQNQYGPTESHVVTSFTLQDSVSNWPQLPPIGRAIANTQIYILDRHLQPLPIGIPGELYIGGVAIARNYINSPKLTAEKFIHKDGKRLYKTGDRARYLPDGNIEFLGRIDNQVKVRGFRIELGEIETVLTAHPQVKEAVVIPREDQPGNKRLVAYIVPKHQHLDTSELLCYLKQKLPEYMLPAAFVKLLDALPLNPNGKIERRALPAPATSSLPTQDCCVDPAGEQRSRGAGANEGTLSSAPLPRSPSASHHAELSWQTTRETRNVSTDLIPPRTATQEVLAGIWCDVLGLEQVGIHDNFFALGGHSLSAMQVIARLRETFQVELPISCLFDYPTIVELQQQISEYRQHNLGLTTLSVKPLPRTAKELPISLTQLEFWILTQLHPGIPVYNIPLAYRLTGLLNVTALTQSLVEIVRRHEALRTTFAVADQQVIQKINQQPVLPFSVIDLRKLAKSKTERKTLAQKFVSEAKNQPFNLEQEPLFRIKLLRLSDAEHLLIVTIHHLVFDGWSVGVFLQELTKLYAAFSHGQPSPLADLPIQYADFAHWQQHWVARPAFASELDYWKQHLSNSKLLLQLPSDRPSFSRDLKNPSPNLSPTRREALNVPPSLRGKGVRGLGSKLTFPHNVKSQTDHPRLPVRTFAGASQTFIIPKSLTNALKNLSQQHNVTLFVTLLTAFKIVLFSYTKQTDIIVGIPFANRQQVETKELIGCFINTLPIHTYLGGNPSLSELLQQVRRCFLAASDRQQMPFVKLVEALQPKQELSHSLFYQVMFNFLPPADLKLANLTVHPWAIETNTAEFDWDIYLQQTTLGSIEGKWCYKIDLFDANTISRAVTQFLMLLELIITNPECHLSELSLLFHKHNSQYRAI